MSDSGQSPVGLSAEKVEEGSQEQEQKALTFSWGIVMLRTKKLLNILDYLAKYRIFSPLGWAMLGITLLAGAFMVWLMLDNSYILLTSSLRFKCFIGAAPASQCSSSGFPTNPQLPLQSYLLLPGINPFIPVIYGLIGIIIAIVVHEGTHGVLARRARLPVKSTGLLFFLFVPIGAFVEVDEKLIQKARFRDSGRIMAGGPGSNIIIGAVALLLLLSLVGGLVPQSFNGVYVQSIVYPSPANTLHLQGHLVTGDLIVAVNGTQVDSQQSLSNYMSQTRPNESLILTVNHQGTLSNYTIILGQNQDNKSIGLIGIANPTSSTDLVRIKNTYANAIRSPTDATLYLVVPGILPQAETVVPFSNTLNNLYTSPVLGAAWYPVALTLFWIFFINVNLAFFNAIPLYPLDGGQALLNFLTHFGRKAVENRAKAITAGCSILMLALILTFLFLPRVLALL